MFKNLLLVFLALTTISLLSNASCVNAQGNSYVSIVNPIRGSDFWDLKDQTQAAAVSGQMNILKENNVPATWLVRFDALGNKDIVGILKNSPASHEKGLFLEVTPSWTSKAKVEYHQSGVWHFAESVFLTGYETSDREKLIDAAFEEFKGVFGYYPKSIGAWWVDSYSLDYMQKKYKINAALIVADQYSTDNYQVWGQYWSTPYYPYNRNALMPAQEVANKIPVVMMQWAARDPVNGYGNGVQESTYSLQANDYLDFHDLDINYFSKLIDIFTIQRLNPANHVVVGLENSYSWEKYSQEYSKQIKVLIDKGRSGQFLILTMTDFATWYAKSFPDISPEHIIASDDPLGSERKAVWYMNPYYRAGWFYTPDGSVFRDIRQYAEGQEEPCYKSLCKQINFATFAKRVLDDVTFGHKLILDDGKISNFKVEKAKEGHELSYVNEAGRSKNILFLQRDISIDGKIKTIDQTILDAISQDEQKKMQLSEGVAEKSKYQSPVLSLFVRTLGFILFLILAAFVPGYLITRNITFGMTLHKIFTCVILGLVNLTFIYFVFSYLKVGWIVYVYLGVSIVLFILSGSLKQLKKDLSFSFGKLDKVSIGLIIAGVFFQSLAVLRSGWVYGFGIGFYGPTGHDGIWHQSLINQLLRQVPPENPIFSGNILTNYHYFFNLLVAVTSNISRIPVIDLLYRFYPILFSLLLGVGTYILVCIWFKNRIGALIALYFVYFAGSFGWIVEYLRERHWGGESAFWVNQPVSFNLNPPFAASLVIIVAILALFKLLETNTQRALRFVIILMLGTLIAYKAYAGIIMLGAVLLVSVWEFLRYRKFDYFKMFLPSLLIALAVFLPQNSKSSQLLVIAPFWFVHSMVDFTDRVGWQRLSMARSAYFERGDWFKFVLAESLALAIFVLGNLGMRFVGLFAVIAIFRKRFWNSRFNLLILVIMGLSFLIPLVFVQKGNPWNTIQFFYYFLYLVAILTSFILMKIVRNFPRFVTLPLLLVVLILTPINAITTFRDGFSATPPARLTFSELEALSFLKNQEFGVVLTHPYDKNLRTKFEAPFPLFVYDTTSYVSAFSGHPAFMEDENQQEIFQNDYKKRLVSANDFFKRRDLEWSRDFLDKNNIRYVYLPKAFSIATDLEELGLKKIFDNEEAVVYEKEI